MQPRHLIGIGLLFVFQTAIAPVVSFAADETPEDPSCAEQLKTENIRMIGSAEVAGAGHMDWFRDDSGRTVLGTLDENGQVIALDPDAEGQPQPVALTAEELLDIGNSVRVRIMPVGSVNPVGEGVTGPGGADGVERHVTPDGRNLLAIVASNNLIVVDVGSQMGSPIFQRSLNGPSDVQWQLDEEGRSVLIYRDGANLFISYPIAGRADFVQPVTPDAKIQSLRANGEILISISSPHHPDEIVAFKNRGLSYRATMTNENIKGMVQGADGEVYVTYTRGEELVVAKLSDPYTAVFTTSLAAGETLSGFASTSIAGNRRLLALSSRERVYFLELNP